jgi:hypothetical protein
MSKKLFTDGQTDGQPKKIVQKLTKTRNNIKKNKNKTNVCKKKSDGVT